MEEPRLPTEMRAFNPVRLTPRLLAAGIFVLALAVFGWGIRYKVSLYELPGSPATSMPHAKLLTEKERPASARQADHTSPEQQRVSQILLSAIIAIAIVATILHRHGLSYAISGCVRLAHTRAYFGSIFFSFRPPPTQFLAR